LLRRRRPPRGPGDGEVGLRDDGDHVLMFGSDFPHAESRFPDSVDLVLGWDNLTDDDKRRLFWDNPATCFHWD
ncbi:MAG: amidohydrolase family protein, partial [Chloroflexi bacterium]|nr:amidohydrolase family protein [Chloroflexota bacterium]